MALLPDATVYTDLHGLGRLRLEARRESPEALRAVAEQFEALFLQMMLKQMREARLAEGLFDSESTALYQEMYDKQIALNLAGGRNGIGLADLLVQQLSRERSAAPDGAASSGNAGGKMFPLPPRQPWSMPSSWTPVTTPGPASAADAGASGPAAEAPVTFDSPASFIRLLWPQASAAARRLGTEPQALLAQAALETGWGRAVIRRADGSSSHNLFNIKADRRWDGERVSVRTLEYRNGVAEMERAPFRAYRSFQESFDDYVEFLHANPRYAGALADAADPERFILELHRAGYATDPDYSDKIRRIMESETFSDTLSSLKNSAQTPIT